MSTAIRFYNAIRLAWWVFWWFFHEGTNQSAYKLVGTHPRWMNEQATILVGRGRDAWRISNLAIMAKQ